MIYQKFSKRQNLTLTWWNRPKYKDYDGIICDGSIRSGKTVSMTDGFILWSMSSFNGQNFAICGKTIESLRRNVVTLMPQWLEGIFTITERRSENKLIITANGKTNYYYMFGGKDESSYTLVQGITLAGVLFDEVALMPRSFVEQAMARCSVDGSKFWFNCNPENPGHWFYVEWIKKAKERNAEAAKRILIKGDAEVSAEAAKVFAASGILLLGNESQTVGPENAPMAVHKILLSADVVLLEGIRLTEVPEDVYFLNAAPLNLSGADGSPCRAILIDAE